MFTYGTPVTGKDFFDRSAHKKELSIFVNNGTDFMLKAPRRYGKTSLVREILKDKKYIYLDFRRVPRLSLLPEQLLDQAYALAGINGFVKKVKDNAISFIKEVKLSTKIDIGIIELGAEVTLEGEKGKSDCEKMILALEVVDKLGKELNQKITVVYDEFQDIKKLDCDSGDILEVLRGSLQHMENLHSIFLGSIESIMTEIFENKKSPFFNYCRKINLKPFDVPELTGELIEAFKSIKIFFENEKSLTELLQRLGGHPGNTMLAVQMLYFMTLERGLKLIKDKDTVEAYEKAYYEQLDLVTQYISEMKSKKNYHDVMYRMARGEEQVLTPQSLYRVRTGLVDMGLLVQKGRDEYMIADSFLEEYLKR